MNLKKSDSWLISTIETYPGTFLGPQELNFYLTNFFSALCFLGHNCAANFLTILKTSKITTQ